MENVKKVELNDIRKIFDMLNDCVDYYHRLFDNPETRILYLANGESFKLMIPRFNVAHMLGIDTNYLAIAGAYNGRGSFEILEEMLEKGPYNFYQKLEHGNVRYDLVFSNYLFEKIRAFKENITFNIHKSPMVCKIIPNRNHLLGKDYEDITHILVQVIDQSYYVLEMKVTDGKACAISSRVYDTEEEFKEFCKAKMESQNLTFATCMKRVIPSTGESPFYNVYNPDKIKRLAGIKSLAKNLSATVDVAGDYGFVIEKYGEAYDRDKEIEASNEQILYDENVKVKKDLEKLKEIYEELKTVYEATKAERDSLRDENEEYLKDIEQINAIARKRINKSVE